MESEHRKEDILVLRLTSEDVSALQLAIQDTENRMKNAIGDDIVLPTILSNLVDELDEFQETLKIENIYK